MAKNHLFSASLYDTLFQHNVISSDGYVKATDEKLLDFKKFLVQQARDKTAFNYKKRKAMVDELCILLEEDALTRSQTKKFTMLLRELNLEITAEGNLASVEPDKPKRYFLGSSEPNKSIWERQAIEGKHRVKVLRADLKEIDKWLKEISNPTIKLVASALKLPIESTRDEKKYLDRTAQRNVQMDSARHRLIADFHAEIMKNLGKTLAAKERPGRVKPNKNIIKLIASDDDLDSEDSSLTATSEYNFSDKHSVTSEEMDLAKSLFHHRRMKHSSIKAKRSVAKEKINVDRTHKWPKVRDSQSPRLSRIVKSYDSEPSLQWSAHSSSDKVKNVRSDSTLDKISSNTIKITLGVDKEKLASVKDKPVVKLQDTKQKDASAKDSKKRRGKKDKPLEDSYRGRGTFTKDKS